MHLQYVAVEHYRAIRSGRVTFEATTVLIGENDCGIASLIEALSLALEPGGDDVSALFRPHHWHRAAGDASGPPAGPLHITVGFRERRPGEWNVFAASPVGVLLGRSGSGLRELAFDLVVAPAQGHDEGVTAEWCLRRTDIESMPVVTDPAALAWLREVSPLVRVRRGRLLGAEPYPSIAPGPERALTPTMARLADRVRDRHAAAVTGTAPDIHATLAEGFEAARDFLNLATRHLGGPPHNFRQIVADILDRAATPLDAARPVQLLTAGAAAERVGVLALVAALIDALPVALGAHSEPILVVEDPEANLHPMTLAAVLELLGHVRWQKILTTQSGDVLAAEPLGSLRRITRDGAAVREWRVPPGGLSAGHLRRVGYHLRGRRAMATFARCWLLVEGETEFWLLPELARVLGYDFAIEGVVCLEFAQCGLAPLVALARHLGIEWHVLSDGDDAGRSYADQAARLSRRAERDRHVTRLEARDIEHCFYQHGYDALFRRLAGPEMGAAGPRRIIGRAIDRRSKPGLALDLVVAASARGPRGVPPSIAQLIATCVDLARRSGRTLDQ